jgi:UDP-glucose 4-epimerase
MAKGRKKDIADRITAAAFKVPLLAKVHPWTDEKRTDMRWLPINQDIRMPESAPLPLQLLYDLIDEASHRALFNSCGCRDGFKCKHYPADIGCLLMGESALEARPHRSKQVDAEEAKAHARRAVEAGLVPIIGKARIDNYLFKIKDRHRMLTVCFCCECCCITRYTRNVPQEYLDSLLPRLEGIHIEVNDNCTGCGRCEALCYMDAMRIEGGRAVIGESCRACGRCASVCKQQAIDISIDDPDFLAKTRERIRGYVKYD